MFWGSAKLILGKLTIGLLNLPVIYLFYYFIHPSWWLAIAYYTSIGLTGLIAYKWVLILKTYKARGKIIQEDTSGIMVARKELEDTIDEFIPSNFT